MFRMPSSVSRQAPLAWSSELVTSHNIFSTVPDIWDKDALWNYAKAFQLLKNNPPEQRLDASMPYSMYMELEKRWSKFKAEMDICGNQRYPSLGYNSLEQEVTVTTTQSALHEYAASELRGYIADSLKAYFSIHKLEARKGIRDNASTSKTSTHREYLRSSKDPDGSFSYEDDEEGVILRVTIEAGSTENYRGLQRDKDMWIKGLDAKVVYMLEAKRRNQERGTYGPIDYRNHTWFVWRRDMREPITSMDTPPTVMLLPTAIGLKMSDFLSDRIWGSANLPDSDVYFDGDEFMRSLTTAICETAMERLINFVLPVSV
ncbi:hypothetical protein V1525DRAFT_423544 [Lipomyces kononenkoae]|uniref:Uncharacterized protein n=1 Tax=Lipomyces kononenkoae TaxID=34357 RepID=A0ACC3TAE4_LIPKO